MKKPPRAPQLSSPRSGYRPRPSSRDDVFLAVFNSSLEGRPGVLPTHRRYLGAPLHIEGHVHIQLLDGDLVRVQLVGKSWRRPSNVRILEKVGRISSPGTFSHIALQDHHIPHLFSKEVLVETQSLKPIPDPKREDWRHLPFLTIDPEDARDRDDAICAFLDASPENPDGFVLLVAIADVAAYVREGSAIDLAAYERGNSIYFPHHVVPMLPERLSQDVCSLTAHQERLAIAVRLQISKMGTCLSHSFHRVTISCAAQLSYEKAQHILDHVALFPSQKARRGKEAHLYPLLEPLWHVYQALSVARDHRNPLHLDLSERKLILGDDGSIVRVVIPPRLEAHRLIEECMIMANVAAAQTLEEKGESRIYRAHDAPAADKIYHFSDVLKTMGIKFAKGQILRPEIFNRLLERVKGTPYEHIVNEMVLRAQAQAEYRVHNAGHFGLHLRCYTHFTSPIRRYSDLMIHRALVKAMGWADATDEKTSTDLQEAAQHLSQTERRAMVVERETKNRLLAHHLQSQEGACFWGRISGLHRAGIFVLLEETGADGFIPASSLGHRCKLDEKSQSFTAGKGKKSLRLGDRIEVRLRTASPLAGNLIFERASYG